MTELNSREATKKEILRLISEKWDGDTHFGQFIGQVGDKVGNVLEMDNTYFLKQLESYRPRVTSGV